MNQFELITQDNYQQAFAIHQKSQPHPWSVKNFTDCLRNKYFAYQIHSQRGVSAYYVGMLVCDEATLMDIAVHADNRNQGLGKAALTHFMQQAEERGATQIWLEVRAANKYAIHMYEQADFNTIEVRENYYPSSAANNGKREDGLIMCRYL